MSIDTTDISSPRAALDPCEALTTIAVASARADGSVVPCEADRLEHTLSALPVFRGQSAETFGAMLNRVVQRVAEGDGRSLLGEAADALPPELRETAFAIGVDVLLADGRLRASELWFVEDLRRLLHVRRSFAQRVLGVLQTKNVTWPHRRLTA